MVLKPMYKAVILVLTCSKVICFYQYSIFPDANRIYEACGSNGVCDCNHTESRVFCQGINITITEVPCNIPNDTIWLVIEETQIYEIKNSPFQDLSNLERLDFIQNELRHFTKSALKGLKVLKTLNLTNNKLESLQDGSFQYLKKLEKLDFSRNKLSSLYLGVFESLGALATLNLSHNALESLPRGIFEPLGTLKSLYIANNSLTELKEDTFKGLSRVDFLDLSGNSITSIKSGFFNKDGDNILHTLFLQRNHLSHINRDAFKGLDKLEILCLYSNQINTIDDKAFAIPNLKSLFLFQNGLINITGNPFESNSMEQLHIYGNEIKSLNESSLVPIPNDTMIYLSCDFLVALPINPNHDNITCVSPASLPSIGQESIESAKALNVDGFKCNFTGNLSCTPCGAGTYGNTVSGGCDDCPKGGYYQDDIAQTQPNNTDLEIPCKLCNQGTFVREGKGESAKDCEVCPEGTDQERRADFRACYCKENYARMDRYGACYICIDEGLDCSYEHKALLPGYMWNWSFPNASLINYKAFVSNIKKNKDASTTPDNYEGEVPTIFPCPRRESCQNDKDNVGGNCEEGYAGWLCTNCEPGYYSVLNACVRCPGLVFLIIECCVFVMLFVLACFFLTWQIKRKDGKEQNARSVIDIVIARIKILLGFYQVVGEIFSSLHDIKWTGQLELMGQFISAFEINILRLFIRPRCFDVKLDLDPKVQFIIGAVTPVVIVIAPFIFYQAKKLYVFIRYTPAGRLAFRSHFENLKAYSFAFVVVLWFVIYPPVCSVIFSLYPMSCMTFSLDKESKYNITRLRSDYDVDCKGLKAYHISAFVLTATYVIAFPAALLCVLCRYYLRAKNEDSPLEELPPENTEDENESLIINSSPHTQTSAPTWLNFLTENYKENFWFWEIVELARKVTQTLLITLFGWEHRLTVIITTCISVLFLLLHARYRPMKSSYEQGLQMFSLAVIFINVVVAANEFPEEHESSISLILVLLNVIVLVIIAGELVVTIAVHIKHMGIVNFCITSYRRLRALLARQKDESE